MTTADDKRVRRAAAQRLKIERKALAGLSRTLKLRLYSKPAEQAEINRTIGTIRFVWNRIWLPMLKTAEAARAETAKAAGETADAWREAWRLHPDPTETEYNRARMSFARTDNGRWIAEVKQTPLTRAARNFFAAVKASRGRRFDGTKRKVRAGRCNRAIDATMRAKDLNGSSKGKANLAVYRFARLCSLIALW